MTTKLSGKSTVLEQRRGPYLRLICSYYYNEGELKEYESRYFDVDGLAVVRFKDAQIYDGALRCSVSAKKLALSGESPVELTISSKQLKREAPEKLQLNTEHWTEWKLLGATDDTIWEGRVIMYMVQVDVVAIKVQAPIVLTQIYDDVEFIDFHLCAADGSVGVHKIFMAAHSAVFRRMLLGHWRETGEGYIELEGLSRQTIQRMKDFLYLGFLPEYGLRPLLLLGRYFSMEDLQVKCIKKLVEKVTADNLFSLLEFACKNNLPELTFELLYLTSDEIVNSAYKKKYSKSVVRGSLFNL